MLFIVARYPLRKFLGHLNSVSKSKLFKTSVHIAYALFYFWSMNFLNCDLTILNDGSRVSFQSMIC